MPILQELIHKLEVGGGGRFLRIGLALLAVLGGTVWYNFRNFKNMSTQEAMDSAQLARNIAQGKGYTTLFIRPFSMYLVQKRNEAKHGPAAPGKAAEATEIKGKHPDLANPPVYPFVLAGLMKVLPFKYAISLTETKPFWSYNGRFWRYQPDFLISVFNQILFFGVVVLFFFLVRRLFDPRTAWLSAVLLFATDLLWRFCVSGLSTILLLLIFMGVLWCLLLVEQEAREPARGSGWLLTLALLIGLLVGIGGMTRYSFGWLILPVLLFLIFFGGQQRVLLPVIALIVFAAVMTPWIIRNIKLSGMPFGTATYTLVDNSVAFNEHRLDRSLDPEFNFPFLKLVTQKLILNVRQVMASDLPRLGGSWAALFLLPALLVNLGHLAAARLRYFTLACIALLTIVQALGRTQLSEDSLDINSENLLILVLPLVLVYGVNLFFFLLDQLELPVRELRYAVIGAFVLFVSLPMVFAFLPPKPMPISYPPYYPPTIQSAAAWVKEDELTMSDMPWAMAWYGQAQCLWLSLNPQQFLEINDYQKDIQELYLTSLTLDHKAFTRWILISETGWGNIILQAQPFAAAPDTRLWPRRVDLKVRQPNGALSTFPLHYWQEGWSDHFLVTARERWPKSATGEESKSPTSGE